MQDNFNALYRRRLLVFDETERNGTYEINRIENYKFLKGSKKYILNKHKKYPGNSFHAGVNRG